MPNDKANMGTAMDALVGTLKQTKLGKQNFGKNDSVIGSSIRHPGIAIDKAIEWLQQEMARVSGMPSGAQDEGSMYASGEMNPEARANSALNMAGLAQVGSMPSAPQSSGGTLGTLVKPDDFIATGARTDVPVGQPWKTGLDQTMQGRNIPFDVPTQNVRMRGALGDYQPGGLFTHEVDPNKLAELMARGRR